MAIEVIEFKEKERWNQVVRSFSNYEVYNLNGYLSGLFKHGDGEPLLFLIEEGDNRAMNIVFKRDIAQAPNLKGKIKENEFFDLASPYGYGGFVVENELTEKMIEEYSSYCAQNGIICEFVRFNPMLNNQEYCSSFYETIFLGNTISIQLDSEEYVWNNFSSKNRNMIRKAIKEGVEVKHTNEKWIINKFMELYNQTMDRDGATDYYYFKEDYYETFNDELASEHEIFYAVKDDEIIAAAIMMFANNNVHYHLSASNMTGRKYAATNLIISETAKFGVQNGYKGFHLGGGVGAAEDSLYSFKKAFNKNEPKEYYIGKKIFDKKMYSELVSISEVPDGNNFFPRYRGVK